MRLYDVKSGAILADGIDIRKYDVKKYRNTIGTVFQDFQIFGGNVKENVILNTKDHGDAVFMHDLQLQVMHGGINVTDGGGVIELKVHRA